MVLLVMGVAGSGKTTIGTLLAQKLGWTFLDADEFHSPANREKMHHGIPLTDADRLPWLNAIHQEMLRRGAKGESLVLACSALRQSYREILSANLPVTLIYLRATADLLHRNFAHRSGHFAQENLVPSQLATLEEPASALVEDISQTPDQIVTDVCARLKLC
ncbi:MAG TPA: gluconokinase [Candidatus Eisenbacteria bacterium]|nr:gluconokinase [Candidatus Eisenbacteria bacterium]